MVIYEAVGEIHAYCCCDAHVPYFMNLVCIKITEENLPLMNYTYIHIDIGSNSQIGIAKYT